jgi:hypothetical protein
MSGSIFINYRRSDSAAYAGRLYDILSDNIGRERLFFDVDRIPAGTDFVAVLRAAVRTADVFLVIIGPDWISSDRLSDKADFVRIEIEEAIRQDKIIIPVLVGGARFPRREEIPASIISILDRQAAIITQERFHADVRSLALLIERALGGRSGARRRREISEAPADAAWRAIESSSDLADYRDFIARFPESGHAKVARTKIEKLLWSSISEAPTTVSVLAYMADFPQGLHQADARAWLASRLDGLRGELGALDSKRAEIEREVNLIAGPPSTYRNDIFVSYSKTEPEITKAIVDALEKEKYKVWWDTNLVSGDEFSDVIRRELVGSRVVVVIWTPTSIKSKWVKAEATMADFDDKLVPVRLRVLDPREIPLPFNVHHCELADDHPALIKAIKKKGVYPNAHIGSKAHDSADDAGAQSKEPAWWKRIFGARP